jgi:sugar lactone lactonase YvrE
MGRATRVFTEDIYFGECPRWREGRLWFSDFFAHVVKSVSLAGDLRTEFEMDDQPSGLGWMPDGSLLVVSMEKQAVLRRWPDGKVTLHAQLPRTGFRSNDMVVDGAGRAYVGKFGFDLHGEMLTRGVESVVADHPTAEIVCVSPEGEVRVVAEGMHFPNGMVIPPDGGTLDGSTLIAAETLGGVLTAFDIEADGSLSGRRVWATIWPRVADGIALNAEGNVWVANPLAAECFLVAPGGEILEVIDTGQICYACMLGGGDGQTLFMLTAPTSFEPEPGARPAGKLLVARVGVPHAGRP